MKFKYFTIIFFSILVLSVLISQILVTELMKKNILDIFVGIDVAYDDFDAIKKLADETSSYTNTFVIGSTGITYNETKLDQVCQYLFNKGLYFMIYFHLNEELLDVQREWVAKAKVRWGEKFLGLYAFDEPGGNQLDYRQLRVVHETSANYTDAANKYVNKLTEILRHIKDCCIESGNLTLFTSDYALYWFDYKASYDVVFAEFGWNYSRQLNVALDRGAATVQNKDWGVMITWTYDDLPYIESGKELYDDLVLAYQNGAKYILVFDTNKNYTKGILQEEHLEALRMFWNYINKNPRDNDSLIDRVAFVLPNGFGYGFRGPEDKIWGQWESDVFSLEISYHLGYWLEEYETKLDIIYDDELELNDTYSKYIFWNGTQYIP
jgi:hypothetical protein